jgi:hypothetical protein
MHAFTDSVVAREQNDKKSQPEDPQNKAKQAADAAQAKPEGSRE